MSYEKFFKVDENGVGRTVTGIPCNFHVDDEDKTLSLTLHYDADLEASVCAPMEKDISFLLMDLLLFVPVRPRRPYKEPSLSKVVGGIVEAMHTEELKEIAIQGLNDTPYVKVSAKSEKARYFVTYSEEHAKCKFSMCGEDGNTVSLVFSRALAISFGQFKDCLE